MLTKYRYLWLYIVKFVLYIVSILLMFMVFFLVKSLNVFKSLTPMDANYKCCHHTANVQHHLLIWTRRTPTHFSGVDSASVHVGSGLRESVMTGVCIVLWLLRLVVPNRTRLGRSKFLRASAMLKHVIAIGLTSVRPSVRHTLVLYQNGWTYCHAFFATR